MTGPIHHSEEKQPQEAQVILDPNGSAATHPPQQEYRLACDLEEIHLLLRDFPAELLRQIPILPEGAVLQPGATYLDLRDPARTPFRADTNRPVPPAHYYVPKTEIDYHLWNRLIGVELQEPST